MNVWLDSCNECKYKLEEQLNRLVQFHESMIEALTWLTSTESKIAELDSAADAAEEHTDRSSLKEELKVRNLFSFIVVDFLSSNIENRVGIHSTCVDFSTFLFQ